MYETLVRPPRDAAERPPLLVLLHGYGSNAQDLFGLAPAYDRRFHIVSLQAPLDLTMLGVPGGRAWFHINFLEHDITFESADVAEAAERLAAFLPELAEAEGCDPDRIYLLGFSQGSMMAHAVLHRHGGIAGIVGLSGRMVPDEFAKCGRPLTGAPVFVGHGRHDPLLLIDNGRQIGDFYRRAEADLTYREYDMAHEINMPCLADTQAWLKTQLDRSA